MTKLARYTAGPPWFTPRADAPREIEGWVYADIGLITTDGRFTVRGYVRGLFAIHETEFGTSLDGETFQPMFGLSHLPTGWRIATCNSIDDARHAADALAHLKIFESDNPEAIMTFGKKVVRAALYAAGMSLCSIIVDGKKMHLCERIA